MTRDVELAVELEERVVGVGSRARPRPDRDCFSFQEIAPGGFTPQFGGHDVRRVSVVPRGNAGAAPAGIVPQRMSAVSGNCAYHPNQKARWAGMRMRSRSTPGSASRTRASSVMRQARPAASISRPASR